MFTGKKDNIKYIVLVMVEFIKSSLIPDSLDLGELVFRKDIFQRLQKVLLFLL